MQSTMDLIKQYSLPTEYKPLYNEMATEVEMKTLSGFGDNIFHDNATLRQEVLRRAGFKFFVKPEFALNFTYAASIYNLIHAPCHAHSGLVVNGIETPNSRFSFKEGSYNPMYKGLLPLWVLNRVRTAVGMGTPHITIHSNDKALLTDISQKDPIIIGWHGFGRLFDHLVCNNKPNKKPRWYCTYKKERSLTEPFGFVIAIFGDGEVI